MNSNDNPTEIDPNGYSVVYFGGDADPVICRGSATGTEIDGTVYAIYSDVDEAIEEFKKWPVWGANYGIMPTRLLVETKTVDRTVVVARETRIVLKTK